jgi:hypothetical protein
MLGHVIMADDPDFGTGIALNLGRGIPAIRDDLMWQNLLEDPGSRIFALMEMSLLQPDPELPKVSSFQLLRNACPLDVALFTTRNGYLGMGSHAIRENDLVVFFQGVNQPFVVRPDGEAYRLLATVYVHGIMRGEAWPRVNPGLSSRSSRDGLLMSIASLQEEGFFCHRS